MGEGSNVRMKLHGGPMGSPQLSIDPEQTRSARLARAAAELEDVLESVDLDAEPELADVLVEAVSATHRAHELQDAETEDVKVAEFVEK